jgi:hypothetical protein
LEDVAHRAVSVQDVAEVRLQIRRQIFGAEEPHLLLDGENHHDRPMREGAVLQPGKDTEDDCNPGLVVRPENGFVVAVDHAVPDNRDHPLRGADRIHMGAEQNGGPGSVPRQPGDHVARVAPRTGSRVIHGRIHPQLPEPANQIFGHQPFPAGRAVQSRQRDKFIHDIDSSSP